MTKGKLKGRETVALATSSQNILLACTQPKTCDPVTALLGSTQSFRRSLINAEPGLMSWKLENQIFSQRDSDILFSSSWISFSFLERLFLIPSPLCPIFFFLPGFHGRRFSWLPICCCKGLRFLIYVYGGGLKRAKSSNTKMVPISTVWKRQGASSSGLGAQLPLTDSGQSVNVKVLPGSEKFNSGT